MATSEPRVQHIRHCLLFLFDQGLTSNDAWRQIKQVYGNRVISKSQCGKWFAKFETGDRDLYRLKQTNAAMKIPTPLNISLHNHPASRTETNSRVKRIKQEAVDNVATIKKEEPEIICIKEEEEPDDIIYIKQEY